MLKIIVRFIQVHDLPTHTQSLFIFQKGAKKNAVASNGDASELKIQQTKDLLEKSQFAKALSTIQAVVAEDESHAEAQYLLGLALGFNGDDIQSEQAFERAEQLGYQF